VRSLKKKGGPANVHLYVNQNGIYWVRLYRASRGVLRRSLKTKNLTQARIRRDQAIAEFMGLRRTKSTSLVEDAFEEFLELKTQKAKNTRISMNNHWHLHLKPFFALKYVDEISESLWLRYVHEKRQVAPDRKFFNDRKYLSMFLHWLHREGKIEKLPRLPNVDPEIRRGKAYSDEEIARLLDAASEDLKLQILMALTMGMRLGEILSLEWSQVDFRKKTIHLPAGKTKIRKSRTFAMSPECLKIFESRPKSSPFVFPSPINRLSHLGPQGNKSSWRTCRLKAKVTGRFHWLRHTFLTRAFKKPVNPSLICHYAGLSIQQAQKTYLHFDTEDTRVVSTLVSLGKEGL
jgi:integrase